MRGLLLALAACAPAVAAGPCRGLGDLPADVARRIARDNGAALFGVKPP
jgi:hypothetical protein